MRANLVVIASMDSRLHLRVGQIAEHIDIQVVAPESRVEGLHVTVLPWLARLNEMATRLLLGKEDRQQPGYEIPAVVGTHEP